MKIACSEDGDKFNAKLSRNLLTYLARYYIILLVCVPWWRNR